MATDSGQKFIRRNRAPRVHITYEDPYNAERRIELPFVMGVMSDLSGNNSRVEKAEVGERKFLEFDMDNFEGRMAAIEPGVAFKTDNKLGDGEHEKLSVDLHFKKMDDFSPAAVARQVPALNALLDARDATLQSAPLHGRQGRGGRPDQEAPGRPEAHGRAERSRTRPWRSRHRIRQQEIAHEATNGESSWLIERGARRDA